MAEFYSVTPRKARQLVEEIISVGLVPLLTSSPGMGKSTIIRDLADSYNLKLIDHRLSTSEPTDLTGLPRFVDGHAEFVPFKDIFPTEDTPIPKGKEGFLLFLDELPAMPKAVQAATFKLVLDRMIGQKKLHPNTAIVGAGNLITDRSIVNPLSTAMQSRLIHLEMRIDFNEWLEDVAITEGYDKRILAFLMQYPSKLMDFQPDHDDKTFCCPRTWEFMNKLVQHNEITDDRAPLYAGTISSGVAAEFIQFTKVYDKLLTIEQICNDPLNTPIPDSPSLSWATITHLLDKVDNDNFDLVSTFVNRFTMDFRILFYKYINIKHQNLTSTKAFSDALTELGKYLYG